MIGLLVAPLVLLAAIAAALVGWHMLAGWFRTPDGEVFAWLMGGIAVLCVIGGIVGGCVAFVRRWVAPPR